MSWSAPGAAADAVGATKMDRPEDFETNPVTGKVYLVCTNNIQPDLGGDHPLQPTPRKLHRPHHRADRGRRRPRRHHLRVGDVHPGGRSRRRRSLTTAASTRSWSARSPRRTTSPSIPPAICGSPLTACPNSLPGNDGLFAVPTEGAERGYAKQFFSSVTGAEVSGPVFNTDNTALFASIQHPGEGGTYEEPISQWPTGDGPPRPSVVVITASSGIAKIGSAPV